MEHAKHADAGCRERDVPSAAQSDDAASRGSPALAHNRLGEPYSIRLVHPSFLLTLEPGGPTCTVDFPAAKERLAKKIWFQHLFFIYLTSPERRVIGMAQPATPVEFVPERNPRRPWVLELAWVIGPKSPGVQFCDVGLELRPRIGDNLCPIAEETAAAFIDRLNGMADLDAKELARLKLKYQKFA